MKIMLMGILAVTGILTGIIYFNTNGGAPLEERSVNAFLHPLIMLLLLANIVILSKVKSLKQAYPRFKNGMENIFLSLIFILLLVHVFIVVDASEIYAVNLFILAPLSIGIVFITAGNTLQRFKISENGNSFLSDFSAEIWNETIRPCGRILVIGGVLLLCLSPFHSFSYFMVFFFTVLFIVIALFLLTVFKSVKLTMQQFHS